jgi:transposase-like protein
MIKTKGLRFPIDVILVCIRWYAAYPLSYRHLEEMMEEPFCLHRAGLRAVLWFTQ